MSLGRLITHLSESQKVPILVDDIKDWIISNGYQDEIHFFPIDLDPEILRGQFRQYKKSAGVYGENLWVTEIDYSSLENECKQRMVCCKEMMHIFDRAQDRTNTLVLTEELTSELISINAGTLPLGGSAASWADESAKYKALSVLAPLHIVEQLRTTYEDGSKSALDIAKILRIPEIYIQFLFSPVYQAVYRGYENS